MMETELDEVVGPKGKRDRDRTTVRVASRCPGESAGVASACGWMLGGDHLLGRGGVLAAAEAFDLGD